MFVFVRTSLIDHRAVHAILVLTVLFSVVAWAGGYQSPEGVKIEVMGEAGQAGPSTTLYTITGRGGNSLAYVTDAGVVLVDSKTRGSGRHLIEAIDGVTDKPVTAIINTHAHDDHTGGNAEFPAGVQIISHENTRSNMGKVSASQGSATGFIPTRTFKDRLSLSFGQQRVDLYHFGAGHTDGDTIVVFPALGVAHFGDLFPGKRPPRIDSANGGSFVAYVDTLAEAVKTIQGVDLVVTGHDATTRALSYLGPAMRWKDVVEFMDFNRELLAAVKDAIAARKTVDEALAGLTLARRYNDYDLGGLKETVEVIYKELATR
jgi:glyoxylase-like metal-dependent hydrolase (beta-lactamase superfamily II)